MFQEKSGIQKTTRGGQITLHNIRMYIQVLKALFSALLVGMLLFNVAWFFLVNSSQQKNSFFALANANIRTIFNKEATQYYTNNKGESFKVYSKGIMNSPQIHRLSDELIDNTINGLMVSLLFGVVLFFIGNRFLKNRGGDISKENVVNGHELVAPKDIRKLQSKRKQRSYVPIANINMVKGTESEHIFIHGTTGSGKSTFIKQLMHAAIEMGDKLIVLDKSCDLVKTFYSEKTSVILNPFDDRSPSWNVWSDSRDNVDLYSLSEALIPMPPGGQDPFWINAARQIFAATAFEMRNEDDKSNIKLIRKLLTADLGKMEEYLKNTDAATLVSGSIEKTAVSIKAVLSTYLRSLKYLKDGSKPFSIRDFVENKWDKNVLFLTSVTDKHPLLRPLISMWLDIAINATMSLEPNSGRKIWIILDEAHSLHVLPSLFDGVNEIRKYGGCFVVSTTSYAGICDLYGVNKANSIIEQLNTSIYFSTSKAERALWISRELGETEIEETYENVSFGANTMRDGVSVSRKKIRKPAVPYTDVMRLDKREAYVKLPGSYPITKVKFDIYDNKSKKAGFVPREINEDVFKDVKELEDIYQSTKHKAPEYKSDEIKENDKTKSQDDAISYLEN